MKVVGKKANEPISIQSTIQKAIASSLTTFVE